MSRQVTRQETIRLVPSTYAVSNATYVSVSSESNMYANTDSTTYGTITHNRANTSTFYAYIRGFNFSSIPSNATVNSFTVKIKASATGHTTSTSSSYYMSLINGTTQIGSTNASGRLSTTTTTFTFANGSLTWSQVAGYGANFGIRIPLRRASTNTADVVSVYGAEIEVNYTISGTEYELGITNNSSTTTVSPSTTQYVFQGGSQVFTITTSDINSISVTDNNVDVTSQLVQASPDYYTYTISNISTDHTIVIKDASHSVTVTNENVYVTNVSPSGTTNIEDGDNYLLTFRSTTATLGSNLFVIDNNTDKTSDVVYYETIDGDFTENNILANSYENGNNTANFTVSNITNAYTSSSSTAGYATLRMGSVTNTTAGIYFIFDTSFLNNIPASVNSFNVTCKIKDAVANGNAITSVTKQLYSGTTPKGSIDTTESISSVVNTIDGGTWTRSELNNIRLYYTATTGSTTSSYNNIFFHGTDLTVSYSCHEPAHYEYTLTNVIEDHNIVITDQPSESLYLKVNGQFVRCTKIYKKINNVWTEVNLNTLTDPGIYIKK